ncbi:hypothetical protein WJX72_009013 [[Myrmecia] bisecta]|uniref:Transmembrane protein 186 n=1 Tax=[Myrmecia] bisecta TaxID=41462 RepID=A0AAW1Q7X9_9CHLO
MVASKPPIKNDPAKALQKQPGACHARLALGAVSPYSPRFGWQRTVAQRELRASNTRISHCASRKASPLVSTGQTGTASAGQRRFGAAAGLMADLRGSVASATKAPPGIAPVPPPKGKADVQSNVLADREVLYRGKWMQPFRLLVRFKIFQLVGVAALVVPINTWLVEGSVGGLQVALASWLLLGCGMASSTLWYYSSRYVGELSLVVRDGKPHLCFSVLDFWGHRQNNIVPASQLIPPLQTSSLPASGAHTTSFAMCSASRSM